MSIILAIVGSFASALLTLKFSMIPIAGWILGPIAAFFSSFLWAGWMSAAIAYYILGQPEASINAGEGWFVVVFFILFIPVAIVHALLVLGAK